MNKKIILRPSFVTSKKTGANSDSKQNVEQGSVLPFVKPSIIELKLNLSNELTIEKSMMDFLLVMGFDFSYIGTKYILGILTNAVLELNLKITIDKDFGDLSQFLCTDMASITDSMVYAFSMRNKDRFMALNYIFSDDAVKIIDNDLIKFLNFSVDNFIKIKTLGMLSQLFD